MHIAPPGLGLLGSVRRIVATRVGLMRRLALAVDPRVAGPLAGCSRHYPSARMRLCDTAAEGHALTYHGSVVSGKLARVLLFVRFLLQVPIPARFML